MRWDIADPPIMMQLALDAPLKFTWHAFVMPNRDIGITVVMPKNPYRWANLAVLHDAAQRDIDLIMCTIRDDPRMREVQPVRFDEANCQFGDFIKVGLDTDRQAAMFKLCFMGSPVSAVQPQ